MTDSAHALDLADDLRRQGKLVEAEKACAEIPAGVDTPEDLAKVRALLST